MDLILTGALAISFGAAVLLGMMFVREPQSYLGESLYQGTCAIAVLVLVWGFASLILRLCLAY